jgi:hypothetical protein
LTARADEVGTTVADPLSVQVDGTFSNGTYTGTTGQVHSRAAGVMARLEGSLVGGFSATRAPVPGFSIEDWWTLDLGFGWVESVSSGPWVHLRIGLAARPLLTVSDHLQIFSRLGYMTGTGNNTSSAAFQGGGYDSLFGTAGARVGRVLVEAGGGTHGYLLGRAAFRTGTGAFGWLGLRAERNDLHGYQELLFSVTFGTN